MAFFDMKDTLMPDTSFPATISIRFFGYIHIHIYGVNEKPESINEITFVQDGLEKFYCKYEHIGVSVTLENNVMDINLYISNNSRRDYFEQAKKQECRVEFKKDKEGNTNLILMTTCLLTTKK